MSIFFAILAAFVAIVAVAAVVTAQDTVQGEWTTQFVPHTDALRESMLSDMFTNVGSTRLIARFVPNDGKNMGEFTHSVFQQFPGACRSEPDAQFWAKHGASIFRPASISALATQPGAMSIVVNRLSTMEASINMAGVSQTITCGPFLGDANDGSGERTKPPTTRGVFLDPPTFSFTIEAAVEPMLTFLRHPDLTPYSTVQYGTGGGGGKDHAQRADFDFLELFGPQNMQRDGLQFYVALLGNEFKISTADERAALKEQIARSFWCSPAPCHMRLRNRTFDFATMRDAHEYAKKHFGVADDAGTDAGALGGAGAAAAAAEQKSWFDGGSGDDSHIIRAGDVTIIHGSLVFVEVSSAQLVHRGFDLPPLAQYPKKPPAQPDTYHWRMRELSTDFVKRPFDATRALEQTPYMTFEAPYAPPQHLRLTHFNPLSTGYTQTDAPLVLTDRCLATREADVDEPLRAFLPPFVRRCPKVLLIFGDVVVSVHPLSHRLDKMWAKSRCNRNYTKPHCGDVLFEEMPPGAPGNAWARGRVNDVFNAILPGSLEPISASMSSPSSCGAENTESACETQQQQHKFPYRLATEKVLPRGSEWFTGFEQVAAGSMQVRIKPLPDLRLDAATVVSVVMPPNVLRNARPPAATATPMTLIVVPSPGVLALKLTNVGSGSSSNDDIVSIDGDLSGLLRNAGDSGSTTLEAEWTFDDFDSFLAAFVESMPAEAKQWTMISPGGGGGPCAAWEKGVAAESVEVTSIDEKKLSVKLVFKTPPAASSSSSSSETGAAVDDFRKLFADRNCELRLMPPAVAASWTKKKLIPASAPLRLQHIAKERAQSVSISIVEQQDPQTRQQHVLELNWAIGASVLPAGPAFFVEECRNGLLTALQDDSSWTGLSKAPATLNAADFELASHHRDSVAGSSHTNPWAFAVAARKLRLGVDATSVTAKDGGAVRLRIPPNVALLCGIEKLPAGADAVVKLPPAKSDGSDVPSADL